MPALARLGERLVGLSARRTLPHWRADRFDPAETVFGPAGGREVVLFADTFNRSFERENLDAALKVLVAGGYRVHLPKPADGSRRSLCCGRTFLSVGLVGEARREIGRSLDALLPYVVKGMPVLGLEPSCLFTFRDEALALLPSEAAREVAAAAMLFEEFLAREADGGRLSLPLKPVGSRAVLHGHCHQKTFRAMAPVEKVLALVPGLKTEVIESSCCGMAGAFGYQAETIDTLACHGGTFAAAGGARGRRRAGDRRRDIVPPPDPRRNAARGPARRSRSRREPGWYRPYGNCERAGRCLTRSRDQPFARRKRSVR